jgi:hypothetical protein
MADVEMGEGFKYGFNSRTLTGYRLENLDYEAFGNLENFVDAESDMETETIRITDRGHKLSGSAYPLAATNPETNEVGDLLTVGSVVYVIESWKVGYSGERAKADFTLAKWDSLVPTV